MERHEIYTDAIRAYGETTQELIAMEECAELIQAISHKHRGRSNNLAEEIADCEIMLEQLKIINNCHERVETIKREKIERLARRVYDELL